MTDEQEQADAAATWDQVEAILDGFSVTNPRPGAKRVADLVAEVERLRAEREAERAAVVAWLREQRIYGTDALLGQGFATVCSILADVIERGGHRREEEG
jgi:uncharacterized small protein (DUF1192 family)